MKKSTKSTSKKVRVAIIGVGNCASSLVQGVEFYKNAKDTDQVPGLMHVNWAVITSRILSSAADVVDTKVGWTWAN
jgi:myo-inositol-1-phosphate synthase